MCHLHLLSWWNSITWWYWRSQVTGLKTFRVKPLGQVNVWYHFIVASLENKQGFDGRWSKLVFIHASGLFSVNGAMKSTPPLNRRPHNAAMCAASRHARVARQLTHAHSQIVGHGFNWHNRWMRPLIISHTFWRFVRVECAVDVYYTYSISFTILELVWNSILVRELQRA